MFYLSNAQCNTGSFWAVKFLWHGKQQLRSRHKEKYQIIENITSKGKKKQKKKVKYGKNSKNIQ